MSDSWQHTLRLEKTLAADPAASYPRLVDGAGCCLPEDCSGTPGSYDFLEAITGRTREARIAPQAERHPDEAKCN